MQPPRIKFFVISFFSILVFGGCGDRPNEVVVYNTVDHLFSEPVLRDFERETGIKVRAVFDTEETKSTGILNRIIAESDNPRCDVFWSGDPLRTQVLKSRSLLEVYRSPVSADIAENFIDPDGQWIGFSSRARVLIYNKNLVNEEPIPHSIFDLTKEQFRGKVAMANPLFGTTTFHIAALFSVLGEESGRAFMQQLKANDIVIATSNGDVKRRVSEGSIPFGLTDTDDAFTALQNGNPIGVVYLDQDSLGTLIIPNTVSLIKGSPNAGNGKRLIDFLLSKETETKLAVSCAQMPLHSGVKTPDHIPSVLGIKAMNINYADVSALHETIQPFLKQWVENP
ncbi:MAG: extracellular solute-binding protein [Crocinitomicaceae bacterium]|nr:extracellular solute-binding protein [Crocinitomicaceae bacterium]